jgi:hypothetical protein
MQVAAREALQPPAFLSWLPSTLQFSVEATFYHFHCSTLDKFCPFFTTAAAIFPEKPKPKPIPAPVLSLSAWVSLPHAPCWSLANTTCVLPKQTSLLDDDQTATLRFVENLQPAAGRDASSFARMPRVPRECCTGHRQSSLQASSLAVVSAWRFFSHAKMPPAGR